MAAGQHLRVIAEHACFGGCLGDEAYRASGAPLTLNA